MGKRREDPPRHINVGIPESLFTKVKILLLDPKTGRVKYRAMSGLMTRLLSEWVEERTRK